MFFCGDKGRAWTDIRVRVFIHHKLRYPYGGCGWIRTHRSFKNRLGPISSQKRVFTVPYFGRLYTQPIFCGGEWRRTRFCIHTCASPSVYKHCFGGLLLCSEVVQSQGFPRLLTRSVRYTLTSKDEPLMLYSKPTSLLFLEASSTERFPNPNRLWSFLSFDTT